MPEKWKPGNDPHQVDIQYPHEGYFAFPLFVFRVELGKEFIEAKMLEEIKELIKEAGLSQSIHFGNILSRGKVGGNANLIPLGGMPGEAVGNILGGITAEVHVREDIMVGP